MTKYSQKILYFLLLGLIIANPNPVKAALMSSNLSLVNGQMSAVPPAACQKTLNSLTPAVQREERYSTVRMVTAYSSTPDQTDDTPFITANGTRVRDGIIAANWLKFGTRVRIPEMYGDKIFIVTDRMHPRFDERVDIWMETREEAIVFGARRLTIEVL
jgi:3D (Asp-Asp-Asp) domain-containing protein